MNIQKIILLIIYLLILILFLLLIYIYKNIKDNIKSEPSPSPSISPSPLPSYNPITPKPVTTRTPMPRQTTKYLLTEQAIMMSFPSSRYITSSSISIFNNLLSENMKQEIIDKIPSDKNISLNCYVLHTNTFVPEIINNQVTQYTTSPLNEIGFGNIYDLLDNPDAFINNEYDLESPYYNPQTLPPMVIKNEDNPEEYDIIGAYFFINFRNFLTSSNMNCTEKVYYSDVTKKISIDQNCLLDIFRNVRGNTDDNIFLFSGGEMPMDLDDFVPKISKFLFYALGVSDLSKDIYKSFLRNC